MRQTEKQEGKHRHWMVVHTHEDDGAATAAGVGICGVVMLFVMAVLMLGAVQVSRSTAQRAADLAALAAGAALFSGRDACAEASRVATANGASLVACTVTGEDVAVGTTVAAPLGLGQAQATARAGPRFNP